jgi:hypothetical protein
MIARHRTVKTSGLAVPTFDPVDTLLTLAFHAARSDGHRLIWLKDVERSLAVEEPDLDELVRRARAARCAPAVGVILERAQSLLGAEVPEETIVALTPRTIRAVHRLACAVVDPLQFDERSTLTRTFTRSVRSSMATTVAAVPRRALRQLRWRLVPPGQNETDCPAEKASYLAAVAASRP